MQGFRKAIFAALLFILPAAPGLPGSKSESPLWLIDKEAVYPPALYMAELGEGDTLREAKANAAAAVAQIFTTRIKVDSTIHTLYVESAGDEDGTPLSRTDVDQTIEQRAEEELFNLHYGESWADPTGIMYIVAYLNRNETGLLYHNRIMRNDSRVLELLSRALVQDEPLRHYAFLDAALKLVKNNRILLEQWEIINAPMAAAYIPAYDQGEIQAMKADQASALKVRVEVAEDPGTMIRELLVDWVSEKGFSLSEGGNLFLSCIVSMEPVALNNDYVNKAWFLSLTLFDTAGYPAVALEHRGRSSGISESAAESRAYRDMAGVITGDLEREFSDYLESFLEK